jgi:hypothetical protein
MIAIPVIASEAKQSIGRQDKNGLLRRFAPRNCAMTAYSNTLALNAASGTKQYSYFPKIR